MGIVISNTCQRLSRMGVTVIDINHSKNYHKNRQGDVVHSHNIHSINLFYHLNNVRKDNINES